MNSEREIITRLLEASGVRKNSFVYNGNVYSYGGFGHYYCNEDLLKDPKDYHEAKKNRDKQMSEYRRKYSNMTTGMVIPGYAETLCMLSILPSFKEPLNDPGSDIICYESAICNAAYFTFKGKDCKLVFGYTSNSPDEPLRSDRVSHVWVEDSEGNTYETNSKGTESKYKLATHSVPIKANMSSEEFSKTLLDDFKSWNKTLLK